MPGPQKTRKKRDTSRKHRLILDKAIEVFTQKGYDSTSMDEIAGVAGVSKRTVYNHFQSKEKLFQEIVADFLIQRDSKKPVEYSRELSLEEQLKQFAEAEIFLIGDPVHRGLSRLLTSVFLLNPELGKATRGQHFPYQNFIDWLKKAKSDKRIDFQSSMQAARIFYGLVEGCITWSALMSDGANLHQTDPLLDEIAAVFLSRYGV